MRSGGGHGRQRLLETIAAAREAAASRVAAHAAAEAAAGASVRRHPLNSLSCTWRRHLSALVVHDIALPAGELVLVFGRDEARATGEGRSTHLLT